ncbi:DUF397 domain-containing protein [Streptomyces fagopyri]|uniref:DUF397 domain-containing protein n=1 Tax=Streptomyces fagopyri TaxID=2662397 RepID=UPI0036A95401
MNTTEPAWFKSGYSDNEGEARVEIAPALTIVHIRDSEYPEGAAPTLAVTCTTWTAFLRSVR